MYDYDSGYYLIWATDYYCDGSSNDPSDPNLYWEMWDWNNAEWVFMSYGCVIVEYEYEDPRLSGRKNIEAKNGKPQRESAKIEPETK